MCLHATFRATHRRRRLSHVEPLESPKQEDLLLATRQGLNGLLERLHGLRDLELAGWLRIEARRLGKRILLVVLIVIPERQPGNDAAADCAAPLHVPDPILENP